MRVRAPIRIYVAIVCLLLGCSRSPLFAQHCPPIYDAYLSRIETEKRIEDANNPGSSEIGLDLNLEFYKYGGRELEAYQLYLIAYLKSSETSVPPQPPADILDKSRVAILHTEVIKQTKRGHFPAKLFIDNVTLAKKVAELEDQVGPRKTDDIEFADCSRPFRLAIFIPFLDDEKYSTLEGLPKDRHECNYGGDRALLFQPLPYKLDLWHPNRKRPTVLMHHAAPPTFLREKAPR